VSPTRWKGAARVSLSLFVIAMLTLVILGDFRDANGQAAAVLWPHTRQLNGRNGLAWLAPPGCLHRAVPPLPGHQAAGRPQLDSRDQAS
jgi:hypothetical protein